MVPEEAPGNLGVGMLDALPARRDQADQPARPSIRERLQALSTPLGRTLGKGDGRIQAPGSKDALDAWNAERGGFADYPRDEEDDYGSEEDKDDDDHEVIDLLSPGSTRGASGLGTALGGGSNWQATYSLDSSGGSRSSRLLYPRMESRRTNAPWRRLGVTNRRGKRRLR